MTTIAEIYNRLPTLGEADDRFTDREQIFAKVANLLAEYDFAFGLCLVHAHCTITDDEIMLGRGNISQPEKVSGVTKYFPERWLSTGQPYEFTTRPTTEPPTALFNALAQLTGRAGVLGLYHIDKSETADKMLEHTEGRKNILMPYTGADKAHAATQILTAWDLGSCNPVTMACNKVIICDSRTTRNGAVHKDTKSEVHTT
ncbi:hypothetical protein SPBR_03265 [Sporothrix brasiliensis 5110]|uniref:Uncharacterized protein n=1 Tax=Sporothrix brasiliensis 5110 TaxID=1398154 RepID=A0A0C2FNE0_9PEZI|nr:uncharacterized protein SPBR_03265 [Sporothrix brasiliensis 5110]KIH92543.1 hypothetical protein SPBR_03265 [Sporothrix brasiliensis 5110]